MPPLSPTFSIGPLVLHLYGIIIVLGAIAAAFVAAAEAKRRGENPDHVWNVLTWCLIAGILGARLYHVLSTPAGNSMGFRYYFHTNPIETIRVFGAAIPFPTALMICNGGLGIFGGVAGGILALAIYARRYNLSLLRWMDIIAPGLILAQAIGRWGNFFNQELYGPPTTLPWGLRIDAQHRIAAFSDLNRYPVDTTLFHPVFLYESLWNLAGFALLMLLARRFKDWFRDGDIFWAYLITYGVGRLLVESLRPDAWVIGSLPTAQIISVVLIIAGTALIVLRHGRMPESVEEGQDTE